VGGALATIAANYRRFAECCLREAGVDGFYFAPIGCEASFMEESRYTRLVRPSDLAVLETLRQAPLLILHIHGEREVMFDLLADYPCDVLSWEDRVAGPSLAEVRRRGPRCLMGGIDHLAARTCSAEEVVTQGREALAQTGGGRGFILAPGCTFPAGTPEANLRALAHVVQRSKSPGPAPLRGRTRSLPGSSLVAKRSSTAPSRPIRNLLKFQVMPPANRGLVRLSVRKRYSGWAWRPLTWILANRGKLTA
jgi:hypothetical protein